MQNNIFNDSVTAITEADFANNLSDEYKIISARPGEKVAALLDVMTEMNQNKLPLAKLTDLISEQLALFAKSRKEHATFVEEVANEYWHFDPKSALGLLNKENHIESKHPKFNLRFTLLNNKSNPKSATEETDNKESTETE